MSEILSTVLNDINSVKYINGHVYFGSSDKSVYKSNPGNEKEYNKIYSHTAQVTDMDSVGGKVVSCGLDAIVRFEDGTNFKSQMPVNRCLSVSEDGSRIALGGPDGGISIHMTDGRLEHHWEGHCEGTVYAVKYMGDFLFTASALCDIRCWQMVKSKPKLVCSKSNIHDTSASGAGVYCLDSHNKRLVSGGADNKAFIWNITVTERGVKMDKASTLTNHSAPINTAKYSHNGKLIATGSLDKTVNLWTGEGQLIRQLEQHSGSVLSLDWNKDCTGLISGSADKTIKFLYAYNATTSEPPELCCPISSNLMLDCVTAEDGQNYSRSSIEKWFHEGGKTSPMTGLQIGTRLSDNMALAQQAQDFLTKCI